MLRDFAKVRADMRSQHDLPLARPGQIYSLTGIRGVAALWVLLFHAQLISKSFSYTLGIPGYRFLAAGWNGVDLFFVLSGFMLMHTHVQQFRRLNSTGIKQFAVSRILRVYPLSTVVLLSIAALIFACPALAEDYRNLAPGNLSGHAFAATLFLATRWFPISGDWNQPIWSLSAEIVGYAVFPILALAVGRITSFRLAIAAAVITVLLVMFTQAMGGHFGQNNLYWPGALIRMAGYFTAGICLNKAARLYKYVDGSSTNLAVLGLLATGAIYFFAIFFNGFLPAAFCVLVFTLYFQTGVINSTLSSFPAVFLGKISFPLYLIHVWVIYAFSYYARQFDLSTGTYRACLGLMIIAAAATAWVLHYCVEKPAHRLAERHRQSSLYPVPAASS